MALFDPKFILLLLIGECYKEYRLEKHWPWNINVSNIKFK